MTDFDFAVISYGIEKNMSEVIPLKMDQFWTYTCIVLNSSYGGAHQQEFKINC